MALVQTRCPGARVHRADHDFAALIVPGGSSLEAQFDLVRAATLDLVGSASLALGPGSRAKRLLKASAGCQDSVRLLAALRPIAGTPGYPEELV